MFHFAEQLVSLAFEAYRREEISHGKLLELAEEVPGGRSARSLPGWLPADAVSQLFVGDYP